ncbi:MAG: right-handed parallel beta-helix repeat-containing protein [Methanospirillum sp.]|uniref:NosD domain-containing protein n=1 Tax=Methanospirillum sp. TaxID=45200 RepID=UPI002374F33E|nr:NosD domain-containing protein [Methanospirillum sp.]MDD1728369.1 right-handed parallel beta-helix repeat-containing protein [Methanospirillum sp.]
MMNSKFSFSSIVPLLILVVFVAGTGISTADTAISIPVINTSTLLSSHIFVTGTENSTIPVFSDYNTAIENPDLPNDLNPVVSSGSFADTGLETMGSAVLVPITPTPEGSGYSYFNTTGTDPGYYISSPGTYILQEGFTTTNSSAIKIDASDVVLDGNAQSISGTLKNTGVSIESGRTNISLKNFGDIKQFYYGIKSVGNQVNLVNNSISDNMYGCANSYGLNFVMSHNTLKNQSFAGVILYGESPQLTENTFNKNGYGLQSYSHNLSLVKNIFADNRYGVTNSGKYPKIRENTILRSLLYGVYLSSGEGGVCSDNFFGHNENALGSNVPNITISNNTISYTSLYKYGIYSTAKNVTISDNTISNSGFGIILSGADGRVTHNSLYTCYFSGISLAGDRGKTIGNTIRDTSGEGAVCFGANTTIINNIITNATNGLGITDSYNTTMTGNQINRTKEYGIWIRSVEGGTGEGVIYNNYLGSQTNLGGDGNFNSYHYAWTNPSGPQRGTNVVGGPFIAGNYWSNADGTGWSDLKTPNVSGYSTTPYEVLGGKYDTAPLIQQTPVMINSSANEWGIVVPYGNNSYQSYTNQTFITEAKPGADITDVVVDSHSQGNVSNWTFSQLTEDHMIHAVGNATPGQVHVFFNASTRYGEKPLTVSFSSGQSFGSPTSWYWQFGDGVTNTTQNPVHTYETPGIYTVTLRALNNQTSGYAVWNNCITVTDGPF